MSDTMSVQVGPKGRVVIPAAIRHELGISEGSELIALTQDGAVLLLPRSEIKRRLRDMFAGIGSSLADELIAERRHEAEREDAQR